MRASIVVLSLCAAACASRATPAPKRAPAPSAPVARHEVRASRPAPPPPPPERWYFERLSRDGQRALLRRIDARAASRMQARVVDVDSGSVVDEAVLPELGNVPDDAAHDGDGLDDLVAKPAFGADLVRAARLAEGFPFGAYARFSTAPRGGAMAFNAGDFVYLADDGGSVKRRVVRGAAYDPRFLPDGKHFLFRSATGKVDGIFAKYELFVARADVASKPRALRGTAGTRDAIAIDERGRTAVAVASREPQIRTCVLSVSLRAPFAVKRIVCLEGGEPLVDTVLSPSGRWAAITTLRDRRWHLRVLSLRTRKVVLDAPSEIGVVVRALSDDGLLVQGGHDQTLVDDLGATERRRRVLDVDVGHRAFFRSKSELVYVRDAGVAVLDLAESGG